jgi:aromatic ring-opening dioxygenase catalytic subunit (LigB family)
MSEFEEFKQSLIESGYTEEIAEAIAERMARATKPSQITEQDAK